MLKIYKSNKNIFYVTWKSNMQQIEAVVQRSSVKKIILEISQNSQENTSARVCFLIKLQGWGLHLYWKRDSGTGVSVHFVIFLRIPFHKEHLWWLLLNKNTICIFLWGRVGSFVGNDWSKNYPRLHTHTNVIYIVRTNVCFFNRK